MMYECHKELQKNTPKRLKTVERRQMLIYSATIPADAALDPNDDASDLGRRLGASTWGVDLELFPDAPPISTAR